MNCQRQDFFIDSCNFPPSMLFYFFVGLGKSWNDTLFVNTHFQQAIIDIDTNDVSIIFLKFFHIFSIVSGEMFTINSHMHYFDWNRANTFSIHFRWAKDRWARMAENISRTFKNFLQIAGMISFAQFMDFPFASFCTSLVIQSYSFICIELHRNHVQRKRVWHSIVIKTFLVLTELKHFQFDTFCPL